MKAIKSSILKPGYPKIVSTKVSSEVDDKVLNSLLVVAFRDLRIVFNPVAIGTRK